MEINEKNIKDEIKILRKLQEKCFCFTLNKEKALKITETEVNAIMSLIVEYNKLNLAYMKLQAFNLIHSTAFIHRNRIIEKRAELTSNCYKCRFNKTGVCAELCENNNCVNKNMINVLNELLKGE